MHEFLNRFFELALDTIHRYQGTVNQFLGDGFMALFGAPQAYEDHARRAVLAALGLRKTLVPTSFGELFKRAFSTRIGVNSGSVVVGRIGDDLRADYTAVGDTTHLADRLQEIAEPGSIFISPSTYDMVNPYFTCQHFGLKSLKGIKEPINVYKVLSPRSYRTQLRKRPEFISSPLVGRDAERNSLLNSINHLQTGTGAIIFLQGEAGIGKSRLVGEVRSEIGESEILWLDGRGISFGQTISYLPFVEIIRSWAGIAEEDGQETAWSKLEDHLRMLFSPQQTAEILPYLGTLIGLEVKEELQHRIRYLDADAMGRQILLSTRRFFQGLATLGKLVLEFEDVHWMDESSLDLIGHLMALAKTAPIVILCVGRSESQGPALRLQTMAKRQYENYCQEILLSSLSSSEASLLVYNILNATESDSTKLAQSILEKAEGNPFFIEEVIRSLLGMKVLVRDEKTGVLRLSLPPDQVVIPDTIQAVILARIDRLEEELKEILKVAAVIGRAFFYRILDAVLRAEQDLDDQLKKLQQLELIREKSRVPEIEYIFKHALVRDATYESLLRKRRLELHKQVAESIERIFGDRLDSLLAYHYAEAEVWDKAQHYLFRAGDQAGKVAADAEALMHYRRALNAYTKVFGDKWDPLQRAILERKMGEALFRRGEHQEAAEYLRRAVGFLETPMPSSRWGIRGAILFAIARQLWHLIRFRAFPEVPNDQKDPYGEELSRLYWVLGWIDYFIDQERLFLDALLALNTAEERGLPASIVAGHLGAQILCDMLGIFSLGERYCTRALKLAESIGNTFALGNAHFSNGYHWHVAGDWQKAIAHHKQAAAAYWQVGDVRRWGSQTWLIGWLLRIKGDFSLSLAQHREVVQLAEQAGDHHLLAWGLQGLGSTLRDGGDIDQAITCLLRSIDLFKSVPDFQTLVQARADLGMCYLRQGKLTEGLALLEENERLISERKFRGFMNNDARNALVEAYLLVAENGAEEEKTKAFVKARQALPKALREAKLDYEGLPGALRLKGTYEWLRGKRPHAKKWWQRSLETAEKLEAPYEVATTCTEIGRRMGEGSYLMRAHRTYRDIKAELDVQKVEKLLESIEKKIVA